MGFNNGGPFAHEGTYDKKNIKPTWETNGTKWYNFYSINHIFYASKTWTLSNLSTAFLHHLFSSLEDEISIMLLGNTTSALAVDQRTLICC